MDEQNSAGAGYTFDINEIIQTAKAVVTTPAGFFQDMPRKGGFVPPMVFLAVMGLASAVVSLVLSIVGLGHGGVGMGLTMLILTPILVPAFAFIGAGIVFVIWKAMGSTENFETAYRCLAFSGAIAPFTALLQAVPYLGSLLVLAWTLWLLVLASVAVHKLEARKAWIVFGVIGAILAVLSLQSEYTTRHMVERFEEMGLHDGPMTPEEAGKAVGKFMKGVEEGNKGQ